MLSPLKNRKAFTFCVEVAIRQEDVDNGAPGDAQSCPIALQLTRDIKRRFRRWTDVDVSVGHNFVVLKFRPKDGLSERYEMVAPINSNAKAFIESVDEVTDVTPGTYGQLTFVYNRTFYGE